MASPTTTRLISFSLLIFIMMIYVLGFVIPAGSNVMDGLLGGDIKTRKLIGAGIKTIPVVGLAINALTVASRSKTLKTTGSLTASTISSYAQLTGIGLLFGSFGDLTLDLVHVYGDHLFILGLVFFLICHVFYIIASLKTPSAHSIAVSIPFITLPSGLVYALWPGLPSGLKLPVIVYASTIATMGYLSAVRSGVPMKNWAFVMLGSLIFLISDAILSWDRFAAPLPNGKVYVMVTYYAAQVLIAKGTVALLEAAAGVSTTEAETKKKTN